MSFWRDIYKNGAKEPKQNEACEILSVKEEEVFLTDGLREGWPVVLVKTV